MWGIAESIWNIASVVGRAFSAPWSGTPEQWMPEQWMMVFTGLCFLVVIVTLLYAWRRDGGAVLRQRFRDLPRQIDLARAQRRRQTAGGRLFKLMLWILIGVGLAACFHWH